MFLEPLPDACPPLEAVDDGIEEVWRTLPSTPACLEHFHSKALLREPLPPEVDLCRASSCSLFTTAKAASSLLKFPKFKEKGAVARLEIPEKSGMWLRKKKHIDFWAYAGFDFTTAIKEVVNGSS